MQSTEDQSVFMLTNHRALSHRLVVYNSRCNSSQVSVPRAYTSRAMINLHFLLTVRAPMLIVNRTMPSGIKQQMLQFYL